MKNTTQNQDPAMEKLQSFLDHTDTQGLRDVLAKWILTGNPGKQKQKAEKTGRLLQQFGSGPQEESVPVPETPQQARDLLQKVQTGQIWFQGGWKKKPDEDDWFRRDRLVVTDLEDPLHALPALRAIPRIACDLYRTGNQPEAARLITLWATQPVSLRDRNTAQPLDIRMDIFELFQRILDDADFAEDFLISCFLVDAAHGRNGLHSFTEVTGLWIPDLTSALTGSHLPDRLGLSDSVWSAFLRDMVLILSISMQGIWKDASDRLERDMFIRTVLPWLLDEDVKILLERLDQLVVERIPDLAMRRLDFMPADQLLETARKELLHPSGNYLLDMDQLLSRALAACRKEQKEQEVFELLGMNLEYQPAFSSFIPFYREYRKHPESELYFLAFLEAATPPEPVTSDEQKVLTAIRFFSDTLFRGFDHLKDVKLSRIQDRESLEVFLSLMLLFADEKESSPRYDRLLKAACSLLYIRPEAVASLEGNTQKQEPADLMENLIRLYRSAHPLTPEQRSAMLNGLLAQIRKYCSRQPRNQVSAVPDLPDLFRDSYQHIYEESTGRPFVWRDSRTKTQKGEV